MDKVDLDLLEKVYKAASDLDWELMSFIHHGKGEMNGEDYEKILDVMVEEEHFLKMNNRLTEE